MSEDRTWSLWPFVVASLASAKDKLIEFVTITYPEPRLLDDIVLEVVSYLDPPDAARAARVCRQWCTYATPVAYAHILLHCETRPSVLLAETLGASQHLRAFIRHITVIHCFPTFNRRIYMSMFAWMEALPEGSLRTFRAVGDASLTYNLRTFPAVRSCPDFVAFGDNGRYSERLQGHRHTRDGAFMEGPPSAFSSRFFTDWTRTWSPTEPMAIEVAYVCTVGDAGARMQQLRDLIYMLIRHTSREKIVYIIVGHHQITTDARIWSGSLMNIIEGVMSIIFSNMVEGCLCTPPAANPPVILTETAPGLAWAAALLVAGNSFSPSSVDTLLARMGDIVQPPPCVRLRIIYSSELAETRGCKDCGVFRLGVVQWVPQA